MRSLPTAVRRGSLLALASVAVAAPIAHAAEPYYPDTQDTWATGVPAGQTEHGVFTSSNADDPHWPYFRRVEYWATSDRWIATATDRNGELINQQLGAPGEWDVFTAPTDGEPMTVTSATASQIPPSPAAYTAPYSRDLVASGLYVPVSPEQHVTVAGFSGTLYAAHYPGKPPGPDEANTVTTVVLQDGTFQPLMQEDRLDHPQGGGHANDVIGRLVSRVIMPSAQAPVQLTPQSFAETLGGWRSKLRTAKLRAAHAKAVKARKKAKKHPAKGAARHHRTTKPAHY